MTPSTIRSLEANDAERGSVTRWYRDQDVVQAMPPTGIAMRLGQACSVGDECKV